MIRSICVWIVQFCMRPALLTGLGCGCLLLALQQQFSSQLGTSQPVAGAACLMIGLAWTLAWGWRRDSASTSHAGFLRTIAVPGFLCAWSLAAPWIWTLHARLFQESLLGSRWAIFAYAAGWAILMLGVPVWCVARLSLCESPRNADSQNRMRPSSACLLGVSLGLGLGLIATWSGLYVTAVIGAAVLLGAQAWGRRIATNGSSLGTSVVEDPSNQSTAPKESGSFLVAMACGGLCLWASHVFALLLPATIYTLTAIVSGVLLGLAAGIRISLQPAKTVDAQVFVRCCLSAALLVLCAGFSMVAYRLVTLTGSISQVWMLHSLRWAVVGCCLVPVGMVWAHATSRFVSDEPESGGLSRRRSWGLGVLLALVGGTLSQLVLLPVLGASLTCYVWLWCIAGVQVVELVRLRALPRYSVVRVVAGICLCAMLVAPVVSRGVRPDLAGRVLFATTVFQADQAGIPRSQLPFLDDSRLVAQGQGEHGVYTVWKSTMARHQVRENGIPHGTLSTDTMISPQDTSELMLALLPLTLHERPNRVAVLGLGASVPLQTTLGCPILEVTAVETDPQLVSILKQISANTEAADTWEDERLTLQTVDPALWVAGSSELFDVVISNPDPSALLQGASLYTQEFYQRAAKRLTADGIFCQRFQFHDYGPAPLQTMAATLRSVFKHVLAIETGPGEIAWLATNSDAGLIRENVVDRMRASHVRSLMATVGWDWSVMLTLASYDDGCLEKVVGTSGSQSNSAANGLFCTQLPNELMRWGAKSQETYEAVSVHASKILNWVGEVGSDDDLLRRLAEVRGQQELVAKFPDQYWGYRSEVRKQISTRPMSLIQQAKHEPGASENPEASGLHPDDKRRLRYFQQLSKAIHSQQPLEVLKLAGFDTPYDPLVSLFMHQELAEIAAHVETIPSSIELTHRLHMLNFAPGFDTSVRNALSALRLVLEKPDCVASKVERWDVINGLLQSLQYRWENRPPSQNGNARLAARDAEESIILVERALQDLPPLATEVGYSFDDWSNRQRVIQRKLLGPLRDYRERLQPMAVKQRIDTEEEQLDGELPSMEDLQFPGSQTSE